MRSTNEVALDFKACFQRDGRMNNPNFRKHLNPNPFNPVHIYQAEIALVGIYMLGLKLDIWPLLTVPLLFSEALF